MTLPAGEPRDGDEVKEMKVLPTHTVVIDARGIQPSAGLHSATYVSLETLGEIGSLKLHLKPTKSESAF